MKITRLGLAWGPAYLEAMPVAITHGEAKIVVYISEGGDLVVETKQADWKLTDAGAGEVRLTLTN